MNRRLSVRLSCDLFDRLKQASLREGISMAEIVRRQLECLSPQRNNIPRFLRHAGAISGSRELSSGKGFARN
jgi:hypothetical protein